MMIDLNQAEENHPYLLVGSRECHYLFGYKKDGAWFVHTDGEDYELSKPPEYVCEIGPVKDYIDQSQELVPTYYQLVELANGRLQVAFLSEKYSFADSEWHIDVFGEVVIQPKKRLGAWDWCEN